jgi:hypothetical protein
MWRSALVWRWNDAVTPDRAAALQAVPEFMKHPAFPPVLVAWAYAVTQDKQLIVDPSDHKIANVVAPVGNHDGRRRLEMRNPHNLREIAS